MGPESEGEMTRLTMNDIKLCDPELANAISGAFEDEKKFRAKYGAKKTTVDGITFDSKLEAERFQQLRLLEKAGEITGLVLQPEFQILQGWVHPETGEKTKSRFYIGDFRYIDNATNKMVVEDTKGMETPEFRLKWDLVRSQYPQYEFRKITREDV